MRNEMTTYSGSERQRDDNGDATNPGNNAGDDAAEGCSKWLEMQKLHTLTKPIEHKKSSLFRLEALKKGCSRITSRMALLLTKRPSRLIKAKPPRASGDTDETHNPFVEQAATPALGGREDEDARRAKSCGYVAPATTVQVLSALTSTSGQKKKEDVVKSESAPFRRIPPQMICKCHRRDADDEDDTASKGKKKGKGKGKGKEKKKEPPKLRPEEMQRLLKSRVRPYTGNYDDIVVPPMKKKELKEKKEKKPVKYKVAPALVDLGSGEWSAGTDEESSSESSVSDAEPIRPEYEKDLEHLKTRRDCIYLINAPFCDSTKTHVGDTLERESGSFGLIVSLLRMIHKEISQPPFRQGPVNQGKSDEVELLRAESKGPGEYRTTVYAVRRRLGKNGETKTKSSRFSQQSFVVNAGSMRMQVRTDEEGGVFGGKPGNMEITIEEMMDRSGINATSNTDPVECRTCSCHCFFDDSHVDGSMNYNTYSQTKDSYLQKHPPSKKEKVQRVVSYDARPSKDQMVGKSRPAKKSTGSGGVRLQHYAVVDVFKKLDDDLPDDDARKYVVKVRYDPADCCYKRKKEAGPVLKDNASVQECGCGWSSEDKTSTSSLGRVALEKKRSKKVSTATVTSAASTHSVRAVNKGNNSVLLRLEGGLCELCLEKLAKNKKSISNQYDKNMNAQFCFCDV